LRIYRVEGWRPGGPPARLANAARRTLVEGARGFSPVERSLYTGLVIGDDREQPATLADDFLGSGLTHLLAVSGQNVAFVLALAGPALRRLRLWPRLFATLAVVALFGLMTRFEPSVLRAAAMAALATTSLTIGSPVSRLRILALSVTALLVVDPLLVRSVGFQLSAAASAAIVLWAAPVMAVLPGPLALREPMAVTVAAQLGVAPVLLVTFGPLPVASFPANVLAVPVAGAVMVWGLTAGMVAGVAGATVAQVLHGPTHLMLAWLSQVAARTAALPLGQLGAPHVAALAGGLAVAARWPDLRRAGLVVAALALAAAVVVAQAPAGLRTELQPGVVRWHAGSSDVVVLGGVGGRSALSASSVLASLRQAGVGSLDLLVVADPSISSGVVTSIEARHHVGAIVVDGAVELTGTDAPLVPGPGAPATVTLGALEVRLTPTPDRLVVDARRVGSTDARSGVAGGLRTP
jgi:ComEC/Rec2-related protein